MLGFWLQRVRLYAFWPLLCHTEKPITNSLTLQPSNREWKAEQMGWELNQTHCSPQCWQRWYPLSFKFSSMWWKMSTNKSLNYLINFTEKKVEKRKVITFTRTFSNFLRWGAGVFSNIRDSYPVGLGYVKGKTFSMNPDLDFDLSSRRKPHPFERIPSPWQWFVISIQKRRTSPKSKNGETFDEKVTLEF